ncbi:GNAT family N-acetyltransferase [Mucilaginibacter ginkgonis]|uniref:GNAT family N-acetyltransferase n=1 Tax=Mucilaginibacter ginkgonis TaxID=2682091 RepID=A0A6I4I539_9SPHI|nr:GNAT family N-acetyltransferase [Mucilaginibacter ginkgonis]QQL48374.1 GNAT family N-acetyltransferase [Mucilaginibacter ginkgonis]
MQIKEVADKQTRRTFLEMPVVIYYNDENWVRPLDNDLNAVFDPAKNSFHKHGVINRWLLFDGDKVAGRIAAFINYKKSDQDGLQVGGIGFFECINNQAAANLLFDTAKNWLAGKGMQSMDGPINFGENDSNWGLLVDGFVSPSFGMNYHPPYYEVLFKTYGFEVSYTQITNKLQVYKEFPERFTKIANWVAKKPGYEFKHLTLKELDNFAADFKEIYNDAWQDFENFSPITTEAILNSFRQMKPIMDPQLIWFAYVNGEPASVVVVLPDANQMIKNLNGKLDLIGKLKFVYNRWKGATRMRAVVMGTKQKFQNHGLESAIFIKIKEHVLPLHQYEELELSWVGDFNEKMLAIHYAMGAETSKKHLTLRYTLK